MAPSRLIGPAMQYLRRPWQIRNALAEHEEHLPLGGRVADAVAAVVGSWPFILFQTAVLGVWIVINAELGWRLSHHMAGIRPFDPYPFILLNLMLSFQAAYTGPVVMMSQNRQAQKDRVMAANDYEVNRRSAEEVRVILDHLVHQDRILIAIQEKILETGALASQDVLQEQLAKLAESDQRILDRLADNDEPV